jgi:hypothetical protein
MKGRWQSTQEAPQVGRVEPASRDANIGPAGLRGYELSDVEPRVRIIAAHVIEIQIQLSQGGHVFQPLLQNSAHGIAIGAKTLAADK